jgi:hypothetical protein
MYKVHDTIACMPSDLRVQAFLHCREVLWPSTLPQEGQTDMPVVFSIVRFFGGSPRMLSHRYRCVDLLVRPRRPADPRQLQALAPRGRRLTESRLRVRGTGIGSKGT